MKPTAFESEPTQKGPVPPVATPEAPHVLYLIDQLVALDGGAEASLLQITHLLPRERYRASVATFRPIGGADPHCNPIVNSFPCPVYQFPLERTYGWNAWKTALRLSRFIRSQRFSIVHTFFETSDLWGGIVAKLGGCPVLISSRRDMGMLRRRRHDVAYRLLSRMFDRVQTVSEAVRDFVVRHDGLDPARVFAIPNGVDFGAVAAAPRATHGLLAQLGLSRASHIIVDAGWIRRVKGTDVMIRAAARVCREFPNAMFLVLGDNDEFDFMSEIRVLLSALKLNGNFVFPGSISSVLPIFKACDIFCHLSRTDGLSNALLEAMACGLPCVITRTGGNPEALEDNQAGFMVPVEDAEAAADRILYLLRNPELARRLGEKGRAVVRDRFSAESMMRGILTLYDDALSGPRKCCARGEL